MSRIPNQVSGSGYCVFVVKRELRRIEAKMYTEVIQANNICRLFLYG